jgi:hypothetical protein
MKDQPPIFLNRYQHPFGHTSGASEIILTDPEHEVIKPESDYAQQRYKTNNRTQKRKTQNPIPRSLLSLQKCPPYFEVTSTKGRRLRLAGVSICKLPVSRMWGRFAHCGHLFGRATTMGPEIPLLWVVKVGLGARDPSGW